MLSFILLSIFIYQFDFHDFDICTKVCKYATKEAMFIVGAIADTQNSFVIEISLKINIEN
jgi:hypothetical protein